MKYTGIIILNYNNWEDTINCVESVEKYNTASIKYVVVDNGSTNKESVPQLDAYFQERFYDDYVFLKDGDQTDRSPKMKFLASMSNDGYARGNNKGLQLIYDDDTIDSILILNNDILFVDDIIPKLQSELKGIPNCGIASPMLFTRDMQALDYNCARKSISAWVLLFTYLVWYQDPFRIFSRRNEKRLLLKAKPELKNEPRFEIELPSGSCMLMTKELMATIGGFDPNTFLYYEEDILHEKIKKQGKHSFLIPGCECIHLGAASTSKTKGTFALRHQFKSSLYYMQAYCDLSLSQKMLLAVIRPWFNLKLWLIDLKKK